MKKFVFLLVTACFFMSCNFTEEITFNEDGSGEFVMTYDLSEVMTKMKEMGMDNSKEDKEPQKMDSILYFKDLLREKADSISTLPKEEQERLKSLEALVMKMRMDEETGVFDLGIGSSFNSLEELPEVLAKLDEAKKINSKDSPQFSKMDDSAISRATENALEMVDFKFDGKIFSRQLTKNIERSEEDLKALNEEMSQMGEAKDMFQTMSYTLVYKFPKAIKSVSNKNAEISKDGKTVKLKMNLIDMVKSPELMNLDVVLED
ncbi:hypothetical protein [Ichthyenterobacterium magnum]|uniref:Lipoprotein n=1 Tax=Ichthyenterobacterium magnum TaxID=1230530 RepID=A0A420DFX9_9FLAO|nr:hypothetical protein [Ichthyenterobacterium magnum]RKE92015.1 hypothetical protein BXY80_2447 [Ichthyenterobacterium magnum]